MCVFLGGGATSIWDSVCLYICGRKNWFRDYDLRSPNLCLGKSITVLLLDIAATNYVTKMKTTEHAWNSTSSELHGPWIIIEECSTTSCIGFRAFFRFLWKKSRFLRDFSTFYGQRLVIAAWATRSPWSIVISEHMIISGIEQNETPQRVFLTVAQSIVSPVHT